MSVLSEEDMPNHSVFPDSRPTIPDSAIQGRQQASTPAQSFLDTIHDMEIAAMITSRQKASEYWRREKRLIWDKCWDHYKQVYDSTGKEPWQATTFIPETTKVIETIVANLHATSMAPHTPIEYQSNLSELDGIVSDHNSIIANDMDKSQFKVKWTDFLRSLVLLGTSVGKVTYEKEMKTLLTKQRNKMASMVNPIFQKMGMGQMVQPEKFIQKEMAIKDYASLEYRDLYDIYPEPYTWDIDEKHWMIEKAKITNADLIAGANDPDPSMRLRNINQALLTRTNDNRVQSDPEKQNRRLALMQQQVAMNYQDPDTPHELYEYWGPVPELWIFPQNASDPQAKYRYVPGWIWLVDKQWVVRKSLNPFRDGRPPYIRGHYIRVPGQWYGIGAAELMLGLQVEINELRNTRVDQTNLSLNKIIAVLKDKVPQGEWGRLRSAPGVIWLFEGVQAVEQAFKIVEYPPAGQDAYLNSNDVKQEIQEVTAATSATVGVGGDAGDAGGKTFRGQLLNKQSATDRFMLYARGVEQTGLADAYRLYYQRIYQFKSYDDIQNILGPKEAQNFEFMSPEQLDQVAKLVPLGVLTTESKGVKLAQLEAFHNQFQMQWWYKGIDVARKELNEMGYPNTDQFVFSDDEIQQYNDARKMALGQEDANASPAMPDAPGAGAPPPPGGHPDAPGGPAAPPNPSRGPSQPIAGNSPGRNQFLGARPPLPANGPGGAPSDVTGRPLG